MALPANIVVPRLSFFLASSAWYAGAAMPTALLDPDEAYYRGTAERAQPFHIR